MNDNKKPRQMNVRISESDYVKLEHQRRLIEKSQSGFISQIINEGIYEIIEITNPELRQDFDKIEKLLGMYGNNLNQIAKSLNSKEEPPFDILQQINALDKNITILTKKLNMLKKEKLIIVGKS
ncbi:plasmid mobilization protein [Pseudomonas gingeri]|uniref:Plasmid mobilization relaxosome protein MobC n=1 Tax=Pseudomonas gingeri TaxID=117681 RepID=A0A7Y8CKN0_9PSED|nr:plasmid mobilization relaxosome protein MobC [Pseudomonas gingeri]NWB27760.1 plasmid mobilization relaxosome protein MobC [Pseudomonas gingeri]NWC34372.1 plasmid mobilization relaxosome protein MobC [Pseudomonas gingeri]